MKNYLEYKGYISTIEVSVEDRILFGTINGINDLLTFEGENLDELEHAFQEAVDDYLDLCARYGKNPEKAYKGQFNVRIPSELHRKIAINATKQRMSLNQYVEYALTDYADESLNKIKQVSGTLEKCVSNLNAHIGEQNSKLWDKPNTYLVNFKREFKEEIKIC